MPKDKASVYQIRVRGQLDLRWADWFEGMVVTPAEDGDTLLTGPVEDQAALLGLIRKLRDLGIPLVSVQPVEPDSTGDKGGKMNDQDGE